MTSHFNKVQGEIELECETEIDSSHFLYEYDGKCRNLHGHRWRIKVTLTGTHQSIGEDGMVADFDDLKTIIDELDHKEINEIPPFDEVNPTAENIARYLANEIDSYLIKKQVMKASVKKVEIWETPDNKVTFKPF